MGQVWESVGVSPNKYRAFSGWPIGVLTKGIKVVTLFTIDSC